MVAHHHKGMNAPAGPGAHLPESFQKPPPIRIVLENRFAPVPAINHVIDRSFKFDACFAGHGSTCFYSSANTRQQRDSKADPAPPQYGAGSGVWERGEKSFARAERVFILGSNG